MYGDNPLLHVIRKFAGSHKRYCPDCGRKWIGRSRVYNNGGVFVFVLLSGITVMFGFFQLAGSIPHSMNKFQDTVTTGIYQQAIQSLADNPMAKEEMKKYGVTPTQALSKLKELKSNPAALDRLKKMGINPSSMGNLQDMAASGGHSKEMIQKAMKYMEKH